MHWEYATSWLIVHPKNVTSWLLLESQYVTTWPWRIDFVTSWAVSGLSPICCQIGCHLTVSDREVDLTLPVWERLGCSLFSSSEFYYSSKFTRDVGEAEVVFTRPRQNWRGRGEAAENQVEAWQRQVARGRGRMFEAKARQSENQHTLNTFS